MKTTDGMMALVVARDAQARLAEAELSDHAEKAQELNGRQESLRNVKKKLNKALGDNALTAHEMLEIKEAAQAAGIGDEVGVFVDQLYGWTKAGMAGAAAGGTSEYASVETVVTTANERAANGQAGLAKETHLWIEETSDVDYQVARKKALDGIRDAISDAQDSVKGEASGQELELQMASQEYSRSSQLASNLLNVRNEVLKSFVQALRA